MYPKIKYKGVEIELTPEMIGDFRQQLIPQFKDLLKSMTLSELHNLIQAVGVSPKALMEFFK